MGSKEEITTEALGAPVAILVEQLMSVRGQHFHVGI
jgi:hypothetical protein